MKIFHKIFSRKRKRQATDPAVQTTYFKGKSLVNIGAFTYGAENLHIRQWGEGAGLEIGKFCSIADNVQIFLGGNHRTDWISTYPFGHVHHEYFGDFQTGDHPSTKGNVIIGNDVWIGSGVTIMSGINIGDGAVIAANSTVIGNVPPYQIVGGNPATFIKSRFSPMITELLLKLQWWHLPLPEIKALMPLLCAPPDENTLAEKIQLNLATNECARTSENSC